MKKVNSKTSVIIIGHGEVGTALFDYISNRCIVDILDPNKGYYVDPCPEFGYDFMMICLQYDDNFLDIVDDYVNDYSPKCVCIFSSVAIGTTKKIKNAVHIPVEGKHPNLQKSFRNWKFFVGYNKKKDLTKVMQFFHKDKCFPVLNSDTTETFKLLSTTLYGLNIEYCRFVNNICGELELEYEVWKKYNEAYNELYAKMDMPWFTRYILNPPDVKIGGHCVLQNINLLEKTVSSIFLNIVKEGELYAALCGDNSFSEK